MTTAVRVVAGVLIDDDGTSVLAARRPLHKREGGLWELPGGKVDADESDADALARELREELGVDVQVGVELAASRHAYAHGTIELVALRCAVIRGTPRALEHAELRWVRAEALATLDWAPADVPLLDAVRRALKG